MRVVAWNCNTGLPRKFALLESLKPDVAIISEASAPERMADVLGDRGLTSVWVGRSRLKGLAVYAFPPWSVAPACAIDERLEWILPVRLTGPATVSVLAVWAMHHRARVQFSDAKRYQVQEGLEHYVPLLGSAPLIVAGDFNNNVTWDKDGQPSNQRIAVEQMARLGLVSAYHATRNVAFGAEAEPTMYWRDRKEDRYRYHIDFCFIPRAWIAGTTVEVGEFAQWVANGYSDHVPLVVDVDPGVVRPAGTGL